MKLLMSAYEHFNYTQMKQRVRRATEMDIVVAGSSYILRTQRRIQQTRYHYFKLINYIFNTARQLYAKQPNSHNCSCGTTGIETLKHTRMRTGIMTTAGARSACGMTKSVYCH
jgi:hypothetical protein